MQKEEVRMCISSSIADFFSVCNSLHFLREVCSSRSLLLSLIPFFCHALFCPDCSYIHTIVTIFKYLYMAILLYRTIYGLWPYFVVHMCKVCTTLSALFSPNFCIYICSISEKIHMIPQQLMVHSVSFFNPWFFLIFSLDLFNLYATLIMCIFLTLMKTHFLDGSQDSIT
jgi:hypothetical protein